MKNTNNTEKYLNLSIRIDNNDELIVLNDSKRVNKKIYIEKINCEKELFIIENYGEIEDKPQKFLILNKLYGNFSLKYYDSIKDLNFENLDEKNDTEISDQILFLEGLVSIYKLKCITPTAFHFQIFSELDIPDRLMVGKSIKTYFPKGYNYSGMNIELNCEDINYEYKLHLEILDSEPGLNRTLNIFFHWQGKYEIISLLEPNNTYDEIFYASEPNKNFGFSTPYEILLEYYLSSNNLYTNLVEGRKKIENKDSPFYALKIRKDFSYDYISFELTSEKVIYGQYELKLLNINENTQKESNKLMVGFPSISFPSSSSINLKFSNPYNKFDQIADIISPANNFYLLFQFGVIHNPVYINIEYIYNDKIINLSPIKSEIITPQKEYEICSYDKNYIIKDKMVFNINKCNNLVNYTLINYYENKNNILKETQIINAHQEFSIDNFYYKSEMILKRESEEEINDTIIYPADYYNKGDILLNYFLIESSTLKELVFTTDFNINYKNDSDITLAWKKYAYREVNNKTIDIPTNYSIYILPKNSIVNTICQLHLIPSNKSIINKTETKIELIKGEYKIAIIATIIDEEMPFEIMYNILEINIKKSANITLIILLSLLGMIIIMIILLFAFRKKLKLFCKRKKFRDPDLDNLPKGSAISDYFTEEEDDEKNETNFSEQLIKIMNKK